MFKFLRKTALWIVLIPGAIYGVGLASNQLVLIANHDQFPAMWSDYKVERYALSLQTIVDGKDKAAALQAQFDLEALQEEGFIDKEHVVMTSKTRLNWLADVIPLGDYTYSIGDGLLSLGEWLLAFAPFVWVFEATRRLQQ